VSSILAARASKLGLSFAPSDLLRAVRSRCRIRPDMLATSEFKKTADMLVVSIMWSFTSCS